jgi:hypothetical protein
MVDFLVVDEIAFLLVYGWETGFFAGIPMSWEADKNPVSDCYFFLKKRLPAAAT